jgi:hypothetical protein
MKAFLEVTEWPDTEFNCNHVYWMDDARNKMYAYAKFGNPLDTMTFKTPIQIDTRGRKFEVVRNDIYGWSDPDLTISANPCFSAFRVLICRNSEKKSSLWNASNTVGFVKRFRLCKSSAKARVD